MHNRLISISLMFVLALSIVATGAAQTEDQHDQLSLTTNQQLARRARVVLVESHTHYMKQAELEKALLGQQRFQQMGLQVTRNRASADLVISVLRAPFQNNFPYAVTDRGTGTVLFGGEVNSLLGTVYGKISKDFVEKLQAVRQGITPGKKPQKE
jgi:hypothetical protein